MNARGLVASEEARSGFYPTPPDLSEELLSGINWKMVENVLEPQAGKGNIVRAAMEEYVALCGYGDRRLNVDCVEIDPKQKQGYLQDTGRVVGCVDVPRASIHRHTGTPCAGPAILGERRWFAADFPH